MRFDEAFESAIKIAEQYAVATNEQVIIVRDALGRNALILDKPSDQITGLEYDLTAQCAPFVGAEPILLKSEMFAPELVTDSANRHPAPTHLSPSGLVTVIERGTVGSDWLNPSSTAPSSHSTRVALYGFKGGVGRSTAAFALAERLASEGHVVLVIDLDLESPGISTMLCPDKDQLPQHGIVDHLVEYGLANEEGLDLVTRSFAVDEYPTNGEVWLSAANGRTSNGSEYLDKLSRVYFDLPPSRKECRGAIPFGLRLERAIQECEKQVAQRSTPPDVILLDTRSGIHDIAAVAITQLSHLSLLFATDNPQTWDGYGGLFARWATRLGSGPRSLLRGRLKMVAALVPPRKPQEYLQRFTDRAQQCFASTLYDPVDASSGWNDPIDSVNFAPGDVYAPHYPIPIFHNLDLQGLVPGIDSEWDRQDTVIHSYSRFLDETSEMIGEIKAVMMYDKATAESDEEF